MKLKNDQALERYQPLIDDWAGFQDACRRPLPFCFWTNPLRPFGLAPAFADGFELRPVGWRADAYRVDRGPTMANSIAYRAGLIHVQEEASLLPVRVLGPKQGERILDLCAAPGNKTAEIACAMTGLGTVVANDRNEARLNVLRTTVDRLGLANVVVTSLDGRSAQWPAHHFDAVLVDAPCSCEGTLRKHPSMALGTSPLERRALVRLQTELLTRAADVVRPGGRIVYSTCTFAPEENEGVVSAVLETRADLAVEPQNIAGLPDTPGLAAWNGTRYDGSLRHAIRLWPHHGDTGGFFAVRLRKAGVCRGTPRRVEPLEGFPDLSFLMDSFGLSEGWANRFRFGTRPNKWIEARSAEIDHDLPFEPLSQGIRIARTSGRIPKLTTQGALLFGTDIGRQIICLDRPETFRFMAGESVPTQAPDTSFGYVQVRCGDVPVGVGLFDPHTGRLESQYPRAWGGLGPPTGAGSGK